MKSGIAALAIAAMLLAPAPFFPASAAESSDHATPKHVRQRPPTEMTFTGKVVKDVWKDKEGITHVSFSVMTPVSDRARLLTGNRAEDGQPTNAQLDKFVGKNIIVVGKAYAADEKDQTVIYFISVTRILIADPEVEK